jgi:hypothetical protein
MSGHARPEKDLPATIDVDRKNNNAPPLPLPLALLAQLERLAERARSYVEAASSTNTPKA